jgi:hypothetical protein
MRLRRLSCSAHQPVGLDRDARVIDLRPQRKADHHEGETEQRADDGDAAIGLAVALIMMVLKTGSLAKSVFLLSLPDTYPNARQAQRDWAFNLTE